MSVICETCRSEVPGDAVFCPDCGTAAGFPAVLPDRLLARVPLERVRRRFERRNRASRRSKGFRWRGGEEFPPKTAASQPAPEASSVNSSSSSAGATRKPTPSTPGTPGDSPARAPSRRSRVRRTRPSPISTPSLCCRSGGAAGRPRETSEFEAPPAAPRPCARVSWPAPRVACSPSRPRSRLRSPRAGGCSPGRTDRRGRGGRARSLPCRLRGPRTGGLRGRRARQASSPSSSQPHPSLDPFEPTFAPTRCPGRTAGARRSASRPPARIPPSRSSPLHGSSPRRGSTPEFERGAVRLRISAAGRPRRTGPPSTRRSNRSSTLCPRRTGPWYQKPRTDPISVEVDSDLCRSRARLHGELNRSRPSPICRGARHACCCAAVATSRRAPSPRASARPGRGRARSEARASGGREAASLRS